MQDSQRSAVYNWEQKVINQWPECNSVLSLNECKELVRRVWNDYRPGCKIPVVHDGRGRHWAAGGRWDIYLPRWSRTTLVVLHEIAHSIQQSQPWHGREFTTLVLEMWGHYAKVPMAKARRMGIHQSPRRVRFAVAASIPHRKSVKWRMWDKRRRELTRELREHRAAEPDK